MSLSQITASRGNHGGPDLWVSVVLVEAELMASQDLQGERPAGWDGHRAGITLARDPFPNLAVFPWTQECGRFPIRVRKRWERSRMTRSTRIWEIPVKTGEHHPQKLSES
jgi:hypothetical protein